MKRAVVNICRFIIAITFVFSGFVKAVDPMGTAYKLQDYLAASPLSTLTMPQWILAGFAVIIAAIEFLLGVFLLFGFYRKAISRLLLVFMTIMILLTAWVWIANPVKDCGCFGDAVILENGTTLLKNIVLLALSIVVAVWHKDIIRLISRRSQWIVRDFSLLFIVAVSSISLYDLPLIDFRPYHIGADFRTDMDLPEFETTFILEKDGKQQEFTIDNYPDSTWTFIDSKTEMISKGYVPPMHDFSIEDHAAGTDLTDSIAKRSGFTFLLVSPDLTTADDANFGDIDRIYEYALDKGFLFVALTASSTEAKQQWKNKTGAEYPFYFTDHTTLKTIVRSNPGLLFLRDGRIIGKWSHNLLPSDEELNTLAKETELSRKSSTSNSRQAAKMILWYVIPLILLTLIDQLWERFNKRNKKLKNIFKNEKKNSSRQLEDES